MNMETARWMAISILAQLGMNLKIQIGHPTRTFLEEQNTVLGLEMAHMEGIMDILPPKIFRRGGLSKEEMN